MTKILVIGGTGAMGVYLVPELLNLGCEVFVTSRSERNSNNSKLTYIKCNAHDDGFLETIVDKYDAIIDFMNYSTEKFQARYELLLQSTRHYIFLSSYRVYAKSDSPITEDSPRLLDVSADKEFLKTDEYSLAKARQENMLFNSKYKNWSIVRPAITYSKERFQLGTLEADVIINRAISNCPVILPEDMLSKQATVTWAGDVALMISKLILNEGAYGEAYHVCTNEHHAWGEIAQYYKEIIDLEVIPISLDDYIKIVGNKPQILYDRMYDRVMDNSKILKVTGMQQKELRSVYNGLKKELIDYKEKKIKINYSVNAKIDKITRTRICMKNAGKKEKIIYFINYNKFLLIVFSMLKPILKKITKP